MEDLIPEIIAVTEEVYENADARRRAERLIEAMCCDDVRIVTTEDLARLSRERNWAARVDWGEKSNPRDPDVVLTTGKFDPPNVKEEQRKRFPDLAPHDLYGYHMFWFRPDGLPDWRQKHKGVVCQPAWQLHTIMGCPYRCAYCSLGSVIRILVNIEEIVEHLPAWTQRSGAQRLFKWDNQSDVTAFEPEYDASRLFVEWFAHTPERYLEIYVGKSANVDSLLDLNHRGKTILQWSLSARTQSEKIEPKTASMEERVLAAKKCQEAGYIVRFRFSPIIPVQNWREENAELIRLIFEHTRPDVISLCAFGWMDLERARRCLPFDLLDPDFVRAMEASAPFLRERGFTAGGGHPIPFDARYVMFDFLINEIRKYTDQTIIALCLETEEMWRAFEKKLGMTSTAYVCNCGGHCTPGGELYEKLVRRHRE